MMRFGIIYKKEMREVLRDRRVVMGAIVSPVLGVVLLTWIFGVISGATKKTFPIVIVNAASAPEYIQAIEHGKIQLLDKSARDEEESGNFKVINANSEEEAKKMLLDHKVKLAVIVPKSFVENETNYKPSEVSVYYDPDDETSKNIALSLFKIKTASYSSVVITGRLAGMNLNPTFLVPVKVDTKEIVVKKSESNDLLVQLLPYLMVFAAFTGGLSIVSDLVAGEKERGTIETLLVSPVSRTEIVIGKFFALLTVCFTSSLLTVGSIQLSWLIKLGGAAVAFKGGLQLTPIAILQVLATLLPLTVFFSSLLLTVSTLARNQRESQTYVAGIFSLVALPAYASMFIGYTDIGRSLWVGAIPVLNVATVLRQALLHQINPSVFLLTFVTSTIYAAAALWLAITLFRKESILFRV